MQETRVRFLGLEDPLEKEAAIHSSTLAWKIPWIEEPDRLQSMGSQRVRHDWATSLTRQGNVRDISNAENTKCPSPAVWKFLSGQQQGVSWGQKGQDVEEWLRAVTWGHYGGWFVWTSETFESARVESWWKCFHWGGGIAVCVRDLGVVSCYGRRTAVCVRASLEIRPSGTVAIDC